MIIKFRNRYNNREEEVLLEVESSHTIDYATFCLATKISHLPQYLRLYAKSKGDLQLENQRTFSDYAIQKDSIVYFVRIHSRRGPPLCPESILMRFKRRVINEFMVYNNFLVVYLPYAFTRQMKCTFTVEKLVGNPNGTIINLEVFKDIVAFLDGKNIITFNSGRSRYANGFYCLTIKIYDISHREHHGDCHKHGDLDPQITIRECFSISCRTPPRASPSIN